MTAGPTADPTASPCTNVCRIDDASGCCIGCWRTLDEIARWASAPPAERAVILAALPARRVRAQAQQAAGPAPPR